MRRPLGMVVVGALVLLLSPVAPAVADLGTDLAEVERRIEDLEAAITEVEGARTEQARQVLETAARLDAVAAELAAAERALADTEAQISSTEAVLDDLVDRIEHRESLVERLRASADAERAAALDRAVEVYMAAHADLTVRFVGGDDPDAGVGLVYADRVQNLADQVISQYEANRRLEQREVEHLAAERLTAERQRALLTLQEAERTAAAAAVAEHVRAVEEELAAQQALLDEIDHDIEHIEGEIASLEREQDSIEALIRSEQARAGSAPGMLLRPVPGGVSSGFGWRIHPIYGVSRLHTGWDMNASCGEPIRAAASGRVFFSGWKGGYGNAVMIDHGGGLSTLYGHQSSLGVSYGEQVTVGETIGWIGTTGVSTGCHLHWEVRVGGSPVDPTPYV